MKRIIFLFYVILGVFQHGYAQKDSLSNMHTGYTTAMTLLKQASQSIADTLLVQKEGKRLKSAYLHAADSLKPLVTTAQYAHFEAQRLINISGYSENIDTLQKYLAQLYQLSATYPTYLVDNTQSVLKTANAVMNGFDELGGTTEEAISKHAAASVGLFLQTINTQSWTKEMKQNFISLFASKYAGRGTFILTELFYREFDTIFATEKPLPAIKSYSLSDTINFVEGNLYPTIITWNKLNKAKIVVIPTQENLFNLVYLISILKAKEKAYPNHDVVILRDAALVSDDFLKTVKRNLTFSNYYIGTYTLKQHDSLNAIPPFSVWNTEGDLDYYMHDAIPFFERLNRPIQAQKAKDQAANEAANKKCEAERKAAEAQPIDLSEKYRATHENITFILRGEWPEAVSTQLTHIPLSAADSSATKPKNHMAAFEASKSGAPFYTLFLLANSQKQEVTLTANNKFEVDVLFKRKKNQQFYNTLQELERLDSALQNSWLCSGQLPIQKHGIYKNPEPTDFRFGNPRAKNLLKGKKQEKKTLLLSR